MIEYDDIHPYGDLSHSYDFELVGRRAVSDSPGAYEIVYAYDNINGPIDDATIGEENPNGTIAAQYAYNNATPTTLHNGLMICFDYRQLGAVAETPTFQATADVGAGNQTLTNTALHQTDNPGSKVTSACAEVTILGHGVSLNPATAAQVGHPGKVVAFSLDLTNTRNITDTLVLSYTGNTGMSACQ